MIEMIKINRKFFFMDLQMQSDLLKRIEFVITPVSRLQLFTDTGVYYAKKFPELDAGIIRDKPA